MPTLVKKRGKKRYLASVMVNGQRSQKLFQDASKRSMRAAATWESDERKRLMLIPTESLTLRNWTNDYLDEVKRLNMSVKTYKEKRSAFKRFADFKSAAPEMLIENIDRYLAKAHLDSEFEDRSGNAVNKDRKNLSAAWRWGMDTVKDWPKGENPFQAVKRYPETRQPRYVPSVPDFWKLYDYVAGIAKSGEPYAIQDRVMLTAYLNLAARRAEIFRLKLTDILWDQNRIRLWTRKREDGQWESDLLPMTTTLRKELKLWLEIRFSLPTLDRDHVFVCLDTLPCTEHYYGLPFKQRRHIMAKWCKRAKVKPAFGFHAIRHLTPSILYDNDTSLADLQAILRHKSPNTTAKYLRSLGLKSLKKRLEAGLKRETGQAEIIQLDQKKRLQGGIPETVLLPEFTSGMAIAGLLYVTP